MATYKHKLKKYFLKSYFLPCKGKSLPVSFFATGKEKSKITMRKTIKTKKCRGRE
jgi:hypothetical protein